MGFEALNGFECVSGRRGLDLDNDDFAAFCLGNVEKAFGIWGIGVADGRNDSRVWPAEIFLNKSRAKAL